MKRILVIVAVVFFLLSCKEREINFNQLESRAGVYFELNQQTPYTGIVKRYDENGLLKDKIEVEWKSFQLDPTLPVEGASESTLDYLVKRKGMPKEQIEGMMHHLDQSGAAVGIEFRQDIAIPVNTFRAHRLIHLAQSHGKGNVGSN